MESHEVLRRAFEQTSPKAVAAELGLSLSLIYKWAERQAEDGSGSRNPLDRLLKVVEVTNDPGIVEWLCQMCGGYFVANPGGFRSDYEVLPATHAIIRQFSELLSEISKAAADNSITPDDAAKKATSNNSAASPRQVCDSDRRYRYSVGSSTPATSNASLRSTQVPQVPQWTSPPL